MSLLIFFIILGVLVIIHELGHFLAAKKAGVLVEEFGFGFPPRVFGKKIGETLYSFNLLPIGGFVKLYGEEYHEESATNLKLKNRAFINIKPWQKAGVLVAGVAMNALLGIVIYYFLLVGHGFVSEPFIMLNDYAFRFGSQENRVIIAGAPKDLPAAKAGAESGDMVVRVKRDGEDWSSIKTHKMLTEFINKSGDRAVILQLENVRNGTEKIITVKPQFNSQLKRNVIGVGLADAAILTYKSDTQKVFSGAMHSYNVLAYTGNSIGSLVNSSFKEKNIAPVSEVVSGPIGIFNVVQDAVQSSGQKFWVNILNITALLSLSLAMMNILPIPALDGGRLVFVLYEWITGKRVHEKLERNVNLIGIIGLLSLAAVISLNDILKLFR